MRQKLSAIILLFALLGAACTMGDPVVGLWETTTTREQVINLTGEWDGRPRVRFDADGKFSSVGASGRWSRIDANRLRLDTTSIISDRASQRIITIKIEGDILTWTDDDGTSMWRRAR